MSIQIDFNKISSTVIQKDVNQFLLNVNNKKSNPNLIYTYSNKKTSYVYSQISFYRKPNNITPAQIYIEFDSVMIIAFVSTDNTTKDMFGLIVPLKVKATSDPNSSVNQILNAGQNDNIDINLKDIIGSNQDFYFTTYSSNPTYNIMIMKKAVEISTQLPIPISPFKDSPFPLSSLQTVTISNIPDSNTVNTNTSSSSSFSNTNKNINMSSQTKNQKNSVMIPYTNDGTNDQYMECDAIIDNDSVEKAEFINLPLNYDTVSRQSEFIQISINFVVFIFVMILSYIFAPVVYSFVIFRSLHNVEQSFRFTRVVATEIDMTLLFTFLVVIYFLVGYYQTLSTNKYNMYLYSFIIALIYFTSFCSVYLKKYADNPNFLGIEGFKFTEQPPYINVIGSAFYDAFFNWNQKDKGFLYSFKATIQH
jgi:hypothetical protein